MRVADYDPRADHDRDLFAVLGVPWNAGEAEVKAGWRAATRARHPDTGGSHEEFLEIQYAWEVLCEPTCRSIYIRAYVARHPREEQRQEQQAGRSTAGERPRGNEGRPRAEGQPTCTGLNSDGSLCTRTPMPGSERCTMHHSQSDDEIERILRQYTRSFFCQGRTREGYSCMNLASKGSRFCWLHGGGSSGAGRGGSRQPSSCSAGREGPYRSCPYTCLVGELVCWDHATEEQRQAAVRRAKPGYCAAVTQRGRPCAARRSKLGFPVCGSHVTRGLLDDAVGRRGGSPRGNPKPPPEASGATPAPGSQIVTCRSCGAVNRLRPGPAHRCGKCGSALTPSPGSSSSRATPPPPPGAGPAPVGRLATLEGVGWGRSRSFVIPPRVRTWRLSWSCGPQEGCPFMRVAKADSTWDDLGTIGGLGLRQGFSHFSETGEFFLDSHINDWWRAEIDVIE